MRLRSGSATCLTSVSIIRACSSVRFLYRLDLSRCSLSTRILDIPSTPSHAPPRDQSFLLMPEVQYNPLTNLILRFRSGFLVGDAGTEYGEKRNDFRIELRARFFF